jgi:hypothetical protein
MARARSDAVVKVVSSFVPVDDREGDDEDEDDDAVVVVTTTIAVG